MNERMAKNYIPTGDADFDEWFKIDKTLNRVGRFNLDRKPPFVESSEVLWVPPYRPFNVPFFLTAQDRVSSWGILKPLEVYLQWVNPDPPGKHRGYFGLLPDRQDG